MFIRPYISIIHRNKYYKTLSFEYASKNTKQKDDVIKAKDKLCKTTIGEKTRKWLNYLKKRPEWLREHGEFEKKKEKKRSPRSISDYLC